MGKTEKASKKSKKEKGSSKKAAVGKAKYTYPKNCTTDADKKKYRSLMRAGKEWEGPGATGGGKTKSKKGKKATGNAKSVILNGKGKVKSTHDNPGEKKAKKKEKAAAEETVASED